MRRTITAALAATALLGAAAPAQAHVDLRSSTPKKNSTAKKTTRTVTATFSGPLRRGTLRVVGPGNRIVSVGSGGRDPRKVSRLRVNLSRGLKSGRYRASYTLVGSDGHRQTGSFSFRLR